MKKEIKELYFVINTWGMISYSGISSQECADWIRDNVSKDFWDATRVVSETDFYKEKGIK